MKQILFALLWMGCACLQAANPSHDILFKRLEMKDNLSHYSVMSLYQDERGLLWMGTRNGVSVYDGDEVTVYQHNADRPGTIPNNYVRHITGDGQGHLFFLTLHGVARYDMESERFDPLSNLTMTAICYDRRLYMAIDNRVLTYSQGRIEPFMELPDARIKVFSLASAGDSLLIGTEEHGLYLWSRSRSELTHILPQGKVGTLYHDRRGRWWIGTWDNGLYRWDEEGIIRYGHHPRQDSSLPSDFVRSCCEDRDGNLWVGTFLGLSKLDPHGEEFENHLLTNGSRGQEEEGSVWSLLCDQQGTIWVGTYFGGVSYFNPDLNFYRTYPLQSASSATGLSFPVVGSMTEDDEGNLWICTDGGGLNRLDRRTGRFSHYLHTEQPASLSHNNVKCLYYDRGRQAMWVGTHMGGLNRLDLRTRRFTRYSCRIGGKVRDLANIVCDIVPHEGNLLLATHDGVYRFEVESGQFTPLFKGEDGGEAISLALDLQFDREGRLWIAGAERGAYCYDFASRRLKLYSHRKGEEGSLSSNGINTIHADGEGRLWFCTSETGLDLYRPETDDFAHYDEERSGLLNNCVYGACGISGQQLLVITDRGFSCLDVTTGRFLNFDVKSGLPLSAVNQRALYQTRDGEIFIGGIDGMVSFRPDDLDMKPSPCRLFPYKLFVNDCEVQPGDESGVLSQSLPATTGIRLKPGQNMFSILYAVTDYMPHSQVNILYKLEHFQSAWTTLRGGRMITYTNLSPGSYTLLVKLEGAEGLDVPVSRLQIEVLPPFYATVWARLFYLVAGLLLGLYIIRTWKNRIRLQAELKYERKHLQDVELLNQHKLRFFTNISHEFRTPLTLIIGQMEMLLQVRTFVPSVYNKILSIYKNGLQLQDLITELLDFRKQEQGHMHIKVSEHNLVDFLYENYLLFREYATLRHIDFKFNKSNDVIPVWYDAKQLQKVVNNLLSNAFKYTPEGGEIALSVRRGDGRVVVEVSDSGYGIDPRDIGHIFDRFYQAEHEPTPGTGIGVGLALTKGIVELHHGQIAVVSKPGEGSIFSFTLPLGREAFADDEVATSSPRDMVVNLARPQAFEPMAEEEVQVNESDEGQESVILTVEDEPEMRGMLTDIFSPYYKVVSTASGEEALQRLEEVMPDLVVCDVLMPGMSGTELCKQIKKNVRTCHIPVMLLTARTAIEYRLEGLQTGADDYITKPFDVNILLARCKNLINNRLLLQEKFSHQPQQAEPVRATSPVDKEFIDRALRIINEHLSEPDFSVNLFAREMGVARTKLFTRVKEIAGVTPNELMMQVRMKKAAYMLRNHPELNIAEIADRVGFCSSRYFSRCFKESYNATPQVYRRGEKEETAQGQTEP